MNYQNVTLGLLKDSDIVKEAFKIMFPDMYKEDSIITLNHNSISIMGKNFGTGFVLNDSQLESFQNLMKSIKRGRGISNLGI